MKPQMGEMYIGVDINNKWIQMSSYRQGDEEPQTVSTIAGAERYLIPTILLQKRQGGQWYYGDEAKRLDEMKEGPCIDGLLNRALKQEVIQLEGNVYQAEELFCLFLQKVFRLLPIQIESTQVTRITFTVEQISLPLAVLLEDMAKKFGIDKNAVIIQDYRESFCYYALCQEKALCKNDVALFEYHTNETLICRILHKDMNTLPKITQVEEFILGTLPENETEKDAIFSSLIQQTFVKRLICAVYLIGEGFEGEWMKTSLAMLCRGKRVFQGKNLYTKGACYTSYMAVHKSEWEFAYYCGYKTAEAISIKVKNEGRNQFFILVEAWTNQHEVDVACEVMLDGGPTIELWLQKPGSKEARIKVLELEDLPQRPPRTTRLRLEAAPHLEGGLFLKVIDLGLGELVPSSGKIWEFVL
ncbi:DUF5716 family protein [Lachnospiraceae bacterium ZAX-1]